MYKIILNLYSNSLNKAIDIIDIELIIDSLYNSGYILKPVIIEEKDGFFIITIIVVDCSNIDCIRQEIKNIYPYGIDCKLQIGESIANATEFCSCHQRSYFIVNPEYDFLVHSSVDSLLRCGDCGNQIPWGTITYLTEEEKTMITNLQNTYDNLESLRLNSPYSNFCEEELKNPKSEYNKLAFSVCKLFEEKLKKPIYLLLKNPVDGVLKEENKTLDYCPICNCKLESIGINKSIGLYNVEKICHNCRIILPNYDENEKNKKGEKMEENLNLFDRERYESDIEYKKVVDEILATFTPHEEKIIKLRFGLGYDHAYTLVEVGKILGAEREEIRRQEVKIYRRLKHPTRMKKLNQI